MTKTIKILIAVVIATSLVSLGYMLGKESNCSCDSSSITSPATESLGIVPSVSEPFPTEPPETEPPETEPPETEPPETEPPETEPPETEPPETEPPETEPPETEPPETEPPETEPLATEPDSSGDVPETGDDMGDWA